MRSMGTPQADREETTLRSYAMDLLRWLRFLLCPKSSEATPKVFFLGQLRDPP